MLGGVTRDCRPDRYRLAGFIARYSPDRLGVSGCRYNVTGALVRLQVSNPSAPTTFRSGEDRFFLGFGDSSMCGTTKGQRSAGRAESAEDA